MIRYPSTVATAGCHSNRAAVSVTLTAVRPWGLSKAGGHKQKTEDEYSFRDQNLKLESVKLEK